MDVCHGLLAPRKLEAGLTGGDLISVNAGPADSPHLLLVGGDDSDLERRRYHDIFLQVELNSRGNIIFFVLNVVYSGWIDGKVLDRLQSFCPQHIIISG